MLSICVFLVLIILALLAYLDARKPNNFPPGPKWFPIIGCAWQFHRLQQKMGFITKASEELALKYGTFVGVRLGCNRIIFVYGLKATQEILTRNDLNNRPDGIFYTSRTWGKRRGILFTDSDSWRKQKQFVLKKMRELSFRNENVTNVIGLEVQGIIDNVMKGIEDGGGEGLFQMNDLFGVPILRILWNLMVGYKYGKDEKEMKSLEVIVKSVFCNSRMVGAPFSHFPFLRYICPGYSGYNEYVSMNERLTDFLRKVVNEMKATYNPNMPRGFIDSYLDVLQAKKKRDSFSEDQLIAICLDLFFAGYETTSNILSLIFLYLLLHPDVQKKAQEEIDKVVGRDRLPSLEDRQHLHYTESILMESTRLFIGRTFLAPRAVGTDCFLNGYFIPKGSILIVNLRGASLTTDAGWENPKNFNPERFIKNGRLTIPDNFIGFGLGKRRCPGEILARADIFLIVAALLHTFNFAAIPNDLPKAEYRDGFVPSVRPFRGKVTLR